MPNTRSRRSARKSESENTKVATSTADLEVDSVEKQIILKNTENGEPNNSKLRLVAVDTPPPITNL